MIGSVGYVRLDRAPFDLKARAISLASKTYSCITKGDNFYHYQSRFNFQQLDFRETFNNLAMKEQLQFQVKQGNLNFGSLQLFWWEERGSNIMD